MPTDDEDAAPAHPGSGGRGESTLATVREEIATMNAVQLVESGVGSAGLQLVEIPIPEPGPDEVLVEVHAVSANKLEIEQTMAGLGLGRFVRLPRVLGMDPSGVVVGHGADVPPSVLGTRVAIKPNIVCGVCAYCRAGAHADCTAQTVLGVHRDGGAAEYVTVPARQAFPIADSMDYVTASAVVHSVSVALHMLRVAGDPGPGDTVLVTGATGAVGSAAVELAQSRGAQVIGAASTPDRARAALQAGIAAAVDYADPADLPAAVRAVSPQGVSAALDTTGRGAVVSNAIEALGWAGTAVSCSAQPGERVDLDLGSLYRGRRKFVGAAGSNFDDVRDALEAVATGRVRARAPRTFPLHQARDAYDALADRSTTGRIVLVVR